MRLLVFLCLIVCVLSVALAGKKHHGNMENAGNGQTNLSGGTHNFREKWVELRETDVEEAMGKIKEERPELTVIKVLHGSMVTMDFRTDRVRVYYDKDSGRVTSAPKVG